MTLTNKKCIALLFLFLLGGVEAPAQKRLPIIDMHMHARTAHHYGPNPGPLCAPVEKMPTWDPARSFGEALEKSEPLCKRPVQPAKARVNSILGTLTIERDCRAPLPWKKFWCGIQSYGFT